MIGVLIRRLIYGLIDTLVNRLVKRSIDRSIHIFIFFATLLDIGPEQLVQAFLGHVYHSTFGPAAHPQDFAAVEDGWIALAANAKSRICGIHAQSKMKVCFN